MIDMTYPMYVMPIKTLLEERHFAPHQQLLTEGKVVEAYSDNEAAIAIAKSPGITARTKHFERWISYVRHCGGAVTRKGGPDVIHATRGFTSTLRVKGEYLYSTRVVPVQY